MDMFTETSVPTRSTQFVVPSTCGNYLASLNGIYFEIRAIHDLELVRSVSLPSNYHARFLRIEWSASSENTGRCTRVLLVDEDNVRVWDLEDKEWLAKIDNGSGGMGKIAHAEFGSDETELLVFFSFNASVAVWSLNTSLKKTELKSPKFSTSVGYGRNRESRTGTFALLARPAAQDIVSLYAPGAYAIIKNVTLPTIDAQGLKWSKGGKWLAVWDTPGLGYKVNIYTADGNPYRTYTGDYFDESLTGLGLRTIEWSPNGDYCAIGGYENTVTLLRTTTFSPAVYFAHTSILKDSSHASANPIHAEIVTASQRSYTALTRPCTLPTASPTAVNDLKNGKPPTSPAAAVGISIITFNSTGYLLATHDVAMPTTAWIWDLRTMQPRAILSQHAAIRRITWHPTNPDYLFILTAQDDHMIYLWDASSADPPRILDLSSANLVGRLEARWIQIGSQTKSLILAGTSSGYIMVHPHGQGPMPLPGGQENWAPHFKVESESASMDMNTDTTSELLEHTENETAPGVMDDTFHYCRRVSVR